MTNIDGLTYLKPTRIVSPTVREEMGVIRVIYPDVFLAGGYLRDRDLAREPKDIDFMTFLPPTAGTILVEHDADGSGLQSGRIDGVSKLYLIDEYPAELVFVKPGLYTSAEECVAEFPFSIQQIWFDGTTVRCTEAYRRDTADKMVTVMHVADKDNAMIISRKWYSIMDKYGGWDLVVPEKFHDLFKEANIDPLTLEYELPEDPNPYEGLDELDFTGTPKD